MTSAAWKTMGGQPEGAPEREGVRSRGRRVQATLLRLLHEEKIVVEDIALREGFTW